MRLSFDKALDNPLREILRQRLLYSPGQGFKYSSPAAHLLGGVLRKATGVTPLKIGELYLRRGRWGGREIISPAFIEESVKVHNAGDFFGEKARYGYLWWNATEGFYARGFGGQYLMVLCTSDWKQPEYPEHFALVEKFILPAVGAH